MPNDPSPPLDLAASAERLAANVQRFADLQHQQRLDTYILVGMAISAKVWSETRGHSHPHRTTALYNAIQALAAGVPVTMIGEGEWEAGFRLVEPRPAGAMIGWLVNDTNGCHPLLGGAEE